MTTYRECKFYREGGKCAHKDAPNPHHSWCIGAKLCGVWYENIKYKAKPEVISKSSDQT